MGSGSLINTGVWEELESILGKDEISTIYDPGTLLETPTKVGIHHHIALILFVVSTLVSDLLAVLGCRHVDRLKCFVKECIRINLAY